MILWQKFKVSNVLITDNPEKILFSIQKNQENQHFNPELTIKKKYFVLYSNN